MVCPCTPPQTATTTTTSTTTTTTMVAAGWYASGVERSCSEGCAALGLICTEDDLHMHNGDVDTSDAVKALINGAGGSTNDDMCEATYGTSPDVPQWKQNVCHRSVVNRPLSTFDCTQRPLPAGQGKQRLCYCSQASP
eukprot:TRINITY_DN19318_c0_g1_i1.p1 TRINITY_DN19318_c0_g1~~TRINITY_DN19318_c0_g1_i1.p1  ORF type:complete len:138 (+),score=10.27 TRINITY_DN19318_c0_g1_i1:2-415(+)